MNRTLWFLVRQIDCFVYDSINRPLTVRMLVVLRKLKGFLDMLPENFRLMNRLTIVLSNPFCWTVGRKNNQGCFAEPGFGNGRGEVVNCRSGCAKKNNRSLFLLRYSKRNKSGTPLVAECLGRDA